MLWVGNKEGQEGCRLATYRARSAVGRQHTGARNPCRLAARTCCRLATRSAVGWQHTGLGVLWVGNKEGQEGCRLATYRARSAVGWQHTGLGVL